MPLQYVAPLTEHNQIQSIKEIQAMDTAYTTTTVQESRNRYNALLAQALERLKARKTDETAQEPEEVTTPATAPQATEEDTTTAPEVVTEEATAETPGQEPEEVATATDDATLLRNLIDHYGNVGADYLDTLDYSQATEIRSDDAYILGRAKDLKQIEYRIDPADKNGRYKPFGLRRIYARNGKRMNFSVHNGWKCMESRAYGKNNNHYKAEIFYDGNKLKYLVKNGIIVEALLSIKDGAIIHVHFNDSNRPETPRDLPAPAPTKPTKPTSKEMTKEAPATTEEVQKVTTSEQEDGAAPYWLLLDNELRAQQEEQEQALATPEKSEQEPEEEPAPDNEETDDPEGVVFLKGAELEKAIDEHIKKTEHLSERLDLKFYKSHYYYYITTDGYIVKLDKSKPKKDLYIPDEGPFYESYAKGDVTDRDIFFEKNMKTLDKYMRERLETPVLCSVRRTMMGDLSIDPFGRTEYSYDPATGKSEELPIKRPPPRELAIYVAAWDAYEADQRARLERYWKRYGNKVCINTYWADR